MPQLEALLNSLPMSLSPSPIIVRTAAIDGLSPDALDACAATLDAHETARAARFRGEGDRSAYIAAHGLLRRTLSRTRPEVAPGDWRFRTLDERGKPLVAEGLPQIRFSLTHTRGLAACAVTADDCLDIGIDGEAYTRRVDPLPIARRFFTGREADALAEIPDIDARARAFIRLWTVKEAVVKATGTGIAEALTGFSVLAGNPSSLFIHDADMGAAADWMLHEWSVGREGEGHALALAIRGGFGQESPIDFRHLAHMEP